MEIRTLIDAYIDVNILLVVSLGLWFVARRILVTLGLRHAYTTQLRLLNAVFLATILSPILAAAIHVLTSIGPFATSYSVNLSDFITAQYLNGSFDIAPSAFENALGFRSRLMRGIQYLDTGLGVAVVGFVLAGFTFAALRLAAGFLNLRRIVSNSTVWRRFGPVELRASDTISIPFSTRALRRRIIVIPSSILANSGDMKVALGHEFQHLRQGDLEWEIGLEFLRPFFFWNPAFAVWKRQFDILRELSCDQNVLARHRVTLGDYCDSLLRICENSLKQRRLFAINGPCVGLAGAMRFSLGGTPALAGRINALLDGNFQGQGKSAFIYAIIPLLMITLISSLAIQKPDDWSQDRLMLSTIVNLERLEARNISMATPSFKSP